MTEARGRIDRLRERLATEGLVAGTWSNGPGDRYAPHRHDYDKVLVAADGSIAFELPELHRTIELATADRLDLPSGTLHAATVGDAGVICLEAHLLSGSLGMQPAAVAHWGDETGSSDAA